MTGSSLFALIDDIATILDDVALMSKVAAKKAAGLLDKALADWLECSGKVRQTLAALLSSPSK